MSQGLPRWGRASEPFVMWKQSPWPLHAAPLFVVEDSGRTEQYWRRDRTRPSKNGGRAAAPVIPQRGRTALAENPPNANELQLRTSPAEECRYRATTNPLEAVGA